MTAGAASWLLLRALIPQLKQRLLDQPNDRSAHTTPTPRGGGVAFVLVTLLFSSLLLLAGPTPALWIPWICAPLALVGLLDDRLNLPALLRYGIQILTAIALLLPTALPTPLVALAVWAAGGDCGDGSHQLCEFHRWPRWACGGLHGHQPGGSGS